MLIFAIKILFMTKIFKFIAIAEGISYIALFANMLIIKPNNFDFYKTLLFPIGMTHGILFMAYIYLAFMIKEKQNWNLKDFIVVLISSLLPFATFFIERKYLTHQ